MNFRLSQTLNARVKAGALEALPLHENPLLDWSATLFTVGRKPFILFTNTMSLMSAVVPGNGMTSLARFRECATDCIRRCLTSHGSVIGGESESVRYAKALNRSVSGSMNELIRCAEMWLGEGELTLLEVGNRLNDTLLSALAAGGSHGYGRPKEAFRSLVNELASDPDRSLPGERCELEQPPPD